MMQKVLIYLTLLIEVLGFSIIIPVFPELKLYYGVTDFGIVIALTTYSLFAFLAAPILGQWSDRIGRKTSLVWCIGGTAISYFILLIQPWYRLFLVARMINGITGGNISIIQAILTDISPDGKSRSKNFGLMGAMMGLGFIIGPILGSSLVAWGGVEMLFLGGGILATFQGVLLLFGFKNTNILHREKRIEKNPFRTIKKFLIRKDLQNRLFSFLLLGVGVFIVNSTQSLYMNQFFGTSSMQYGYFMSFVGVIASLNMGLLVSKVWRKYLSLRQILWINFVVLLVGYTVLGFLADESRYMILYIGVILGSGVYRVMYNIYVMGHAEKHEIGEISGMMGSLQNITMIVGPLLGGILLQFGYNVHRGSVFFFLIAFFIMRKVLFHTPISGDLSTKLH